MCKSMKLTKDQLKTVVNKIKNPISLEEAVFLCFEIHGSFYKKNFIRK